MDAKVKRFQPSDYVHYNFVFQAKWCAVPPNGIRGTIVRATLTGTKDVPHFPFLNHVTKYSESWFSNIWDKRHKLKLPHTYNGEYQLDLEPFAGAAAAAAAGLEE
jgi:hypothetical protein